MPRNLREAVAVAIYETECDCTIPSDMPMAGFMGGYGPVADAAIAAMLDWLIAEAAALEMESRAWKRYGENRKFQAFIMPTADWLRSFREAGQ